MTVNMGTQTYEMSCKQEKAILGTAKKLAIETYTASKKVMRRL